MQMNLVTFVLSLRLVMENWGLVCCFFFNRLQIPLYCVAACQF